MAELEVGILDEEEVLAACLELDDVERGVGGNGVERDPATEVREVVRRGRLVERLLLLLLRVLLLLSSAGTREALEGGSLRGETVRGERGRVEGLGWRGGRKAERGVPRVARLLLLLLSLLMLLLLLPAEAHRRPKVRRSLRAR